MKIRCPERWLDLIAARSHLKTPTKSDFFKDPMGDAEYAWRVFGGLTLPAAYSKYLEMPESYQEAFLWMFPSSFEYYFPVIDQYLRSVDICRDTDVTIEGCQAEILGFAIESQFHWKDESLPPDYVIQEIQSLANFVLEHLTKYSPCDSDQEDIASSWLKLVTTIKQLS